jgi:hypothetical protein
VTNAPSPPAGRKTELLRWLSEEGRFAPDFGRLLEALCEKLTALGVPIARATTHVRTLHPEFRGVTRIWRRGESIEFRTTRHGIEFTSDYQNSPIQYVIKTGQWLDTILSETTDRYFPILATLRAEGITHYVMAPLIFSNRIVNAMSWATDAPGGFTEADVELVRDLKQVPQLRHRAREGRGVGLKAIGSSMGPSRTIIGTIGVISCHPVQKLRRATRAPYDPYALRFGVQSSLLG